MTSISVVIGIFGDMTVWGPLADRAADSAWAQTVHGGEVIVSNGPTLQLARNRGARRATGDHLVFLDADDTLDRRYLAAMTAAVAEHPGRHLYQPANLDCPLDGPPLGPAACIPPRSRSGRLTDGNHLVIGTMVHRALFWEVGGFDDFEAWEDWALWMRCEAAGATVVPVPDAIYQVGVRVPSRNTITPKEGGLLARRIHRRHQEWLNSRRGDRA